MTILIYAILICQGLRIESAFAQTTMTNQSGATAIGKEFQYIVPIIVGIIALIAGIIGYLIKYYFDKKIELQKQQYSLESKNLEHKHKLEAEYDLDLRTKRIEAYKDIWSELHVLRFHNKPDKITYKEIKSLERRLVTWYYETGGMFLTETSSKIYTMFIQELHEITENVQTDDEKEPINKDPEILERTRRFASIFRTNLCKDIGTREESKNPSLYSDLRIITDKENYKLDDPITITVKNIGNKALEIPDGVLGLEIRNLIDLNSHVFIKQPVKILDTLEEKQIKCTEKLSVGNYIARITFGSVSSIKDFQIYPK